MRSIVGLALAACLLLAALPAWAQVEEPTRVTNDLFRFAYTFEANSLVSYEEGGNGFNCIHNPQGGGKGTAADYGMQVFGGVVMTFSKDEAAAAKLDPPEATTLTAAEIRNNTRLSELMKAAMGAHERQSAGDAVIKVEDGSTVKVPYFTWSKTAAGKTHFALMYVVLHGDTFINVQVESTRPFSKAQEQWFTTKLELLKQPITVN